MGAGNFTDDFKRDAVAQITERGYRWAIEDSFETAKNEVGLDHNETRSWHRHVSLVMLAFAMMITIRHHAKTVTPTKSMVRIINAPRRC